MWHIQISKPGHAYGDCDAYTIYDMIYDMIDFISRIMRNMFSLAMHMVCYGFVTISITLTISYWAR
jgi:hypothetical protein